MEVSKREQIVIDILAHSAEDELTTSEVLDEARAYDDTLQHNRQITRVFDALEERGLISTRTGNSNPPLAPARLARLTLAGERAAMEITVTPIDADSLNDLTDELYQTREALDELSAKTLTGADLDAVEGEIDRLDERLNRIDEMVEEAVKNAEKAKETANTTEENVAETLQNQEVRLQALDRSMDKLKDLFEKLLEASKSSKKQR